MQVAALPSFAAPAFDPEIFGSAIRPIQTEAAFARLPVRFQNLIRAVPLRRVTIQDVHDSGDRTQPLIALIQDVHMNAEAQSNIAATLQSFIDEKQVGVVGVEGAFEKFDFSPFRNFKEKDVVKNVADSFLNNSLLAASSYVGITSAVEPPLFVGIDDKRHYQRNVRAYLQSRASKDRILNVLNRTERSLAEEKKKVFSAELLRFDALRTAHHEGRLGVGGYLETLSRNYSASVLNAPLTIQQFLAAHKMESTLNFTRVETERTKIIGRLTQMLDENEKSQLIAASLAYRLGKIGFGDYYRNLKNLCEKKGIALGAAPAFDHYIRYVLLADGIKSDELLKAVEDIEDDIQKTLAKSDDEKKLSALSERILLAKKLTTFSLTSAEWDKYKAGSALPLSDVDLRPFEHFYEEADSRSRAMVRNIFDGGSANAALIAGGFHTTLLEKILRDHNISYVLLSPKISKIEDATGSSYLSVFACEKTPLDRLFSGEKLFLKPFDEEIEDPGKAARTIGVMHADMGDSVKIPITRERFFLRKIFVDMIVTKGIEPAKSTCRLVNERWMNVRKFFAALIDFIQRHRLIVEWSEWVVPGFGLAFPGGSLPSTLRFPTFFLSARAPLEPIEANTGDSVPNRHDDSGLPPSAWKKEVEAWEARVRQGQTVRLPIAPAWARGTTIIRLGNNIEVLDMADAVPTPPFPARYYLLAEPIEAQINRKLEYWKTLSSRVIQTSDFPLMAHPVNVFPLQENQLTEFLSMVRKGSPRNVVFQSPYLNESLIHAYFKGSSWDNILTNGIEFVDDESWRADLRRFLKNIPPKQRKEKKDSYHR